MYVTQLHQALPRATATYISAKMVFAVGFDS